MALEDRDWYRDEPSKAWTTRWDASPTPGGGRTTRGPVRVYHGALLAILVSGVLAFATWQWNLIPTFKLGGSNPARLTNEPAPAQPSDKIIRLGSKPGFDVPATRVTTWWITVPRLGKVSVYVPIGKTPREALTVELAARGYQVVR